MNRLHVLLRTYITSHLIGNLGRYINHSCEPNLEMRLVRCPDSMVPQLGLFARMEISADKELTFNYGDPLAKGEQPPNLGNIPCRCQSDKCYGKLPFQALQKIDEKISSSGKI